MMFFKCALLATASLAKAENVNDASALVQMSMSQADQQRAVNEDLKTQSEALKRFASPVVEDMSEELMKGALEVGKRVMSGTWDADVSFMEQFQNKVNRAATDVGVKDMSIRASKRIAESYLKAEAKGESYPKGPVRPFGIDSIFTGFEFHVAVPSLLQKANPEWNAWLGFVIDWSMFYPVCIRHVGCPDYGYIQPQKFWDAKSCVQIQGGGNLQLGKHFSDPMHHDLEIVPVFLVGFGNNSFLRGPIIEVALEVGTENYALPAPTLKWEISAWKTQKGDPVWPHWLIFQISSPKMDLGNIVLSRHDGHEPEAVEKNAGHGTAASGGHGTWIQEAMHHFMLQVPVLGGITFCGGSSAWNETLAVSGSGSGEHDE